MSNSGGEVCLLDGDLHRRRHALAVGAARLRATAEPAPPSVVCAHRSGGNTGGGSAATGEVDVTLIRVDEDTCPEELREALCSLAARAKREQSIVGPADRPSMWDARHEAINELLDRLDLA